MDWIRFIIRHSKSVRLSVRPVRQIRLILMSFINVLVRMIVSRIRSMIRHFMNVLRRLRFVIRVKGMIARL